MNIVVGNVNNVIDIFIQIAPLKSEKFNLIPKNFSFLLIINTANNVSKKHSPNKSS